eukprot:scaffold12924_cov125-Isochrysis_galbana.AAC.5
MTGLGAKARCTRMSSTIGPRRARHKTRLATSAFRARRAARRSLALARCCYDLCRCSDYLHMAYGAMAHMAARSSHPGPTLRRAHAPAVQARALVPADRYPPRWSMPLSAVSMLEHAPADCELAALLSADTHAICIRTRLTTYPYVFGAAAAAPRQLVQLLCSYCATTHTTAQRRGAPLRTRTNLLDLATRIELAGKADTRKRAGPGRSDPPLTSQYAPMDVRAPLPSGRGIGLGCRSPHVAVLRSRECSSLTAGIKSLVVQMLDAAPDVPCETQRALTARAASGAWAAKGSSRTACAPEHVGHEALARRMRRRTRYHCTRSSPGLLTGCSGGGARRPAACGLLAARPVRRGGEPDGSCSSGGMQPNRSSAPPLPKLYESTSPSRR